MNESLFEKIFKVHCSEQEGPKPTNGIKECTIHLCVYFIITHLNMCISELRNRYFNLV
jgi:hypothetical protein